VKQNLIFEYRTPNID